VSHLFFNQLFVPSVYIVIRNQSKQIDNDSVDSLPLHWRGILHKVVTPIVDGIVDELVKEEAVDDILLALYGLDGPKPF
jgi:hypothetical protein